MLAIASDLFGKLYADMGYIGKGFARKRKNKVKDKGLDQVTRVRSPSNFAVNLMVGIAAYCLQPVKPRIALRDSTRDILPVN